MERDYQKFTWREMASYHQELRKEIFDEVENNFKFLSIKCSEISFQQANEANSWKKQWNKPNRAASWDWVELYHQYHTRSAARRFDMAISKNGGLVGLCYGMMERDRLVLILHAIEHSPLPGNTVSGHVVDINLYAADLYANLNGSREIWLCNPVSPAHVRLYQSKGYTSHENYHGIVTHLVMRL